MKKNLKRLTEQDIRNIAKKCILEYYDEYGDGRYDDNDSDVPTLTCTETIDNYNAREIADDFGYETTDEGAAEWFKEVAPEAGFEENTMPKYSKFKMHIPELDADMYYDWYAEYYFLVKEAMTDKMKNESRNVNKKKVIRLTEGDLHNIIRKSVQRILNA